MSDRQALHQAIFSKRSVVVVVVVVGLGGVGAKLARKGLPAGSWHWQALPKTFFSKRIVVVVVVVVGLGGGQAFQVLSGLSDILLHACSHNRVNKSWPATDINNNKNQQRKMTGFGKQPISYYKA